MLASLRTSLNGLTTRGRCLLAAGLALALCAVVLGQRDLLRAAVFLVALPLAALAIVSRSRYRLACARSLAPPRVEAGSPTTVQLQLDNVSRLPSGVLLMEDALPYTLGGRPRFVLDKIEPRGVRAVSYAVRSDARGRYRIGPLSVRLTDPFGLCELARSFASSDELVVTPVVTPLPAVRLGGDWTGGGDATSRAVAVSGADDAATREYRYGDDLRKVHWKSTARTGELMVRREEQPFQSRATLLLDGRELAHRGEGPGSSFEWAVSAVASIGVTLARAGFALSLLRESGQAVAPVGVPLTESLLLDELAVVRTAQRRSLDGAVEVLRTGGLGGVLVAVLGAVDVDQAERLARLRTGSAVCVAVVVDTDSWAPLAPRIRADAVETHERVCTLLTGAGWRVLPAGHGTGLAGVWPLAGGRSGGGGALGGGRSDASPSPAVPSPARAPHPPLSGARP
ncbi:MAG: FIG002343: hypothetical protein [uncultured Frankineae bacterium]|uniref:DUF58 domain-containing protein n=1 Tax=uncultured Frankineae bacterium TaxID=437475 RepID=A0A6J4L7H4_9ACTN|nr:MAG: FIG002343: hypothetical protein [uncultured Frankineae bacterium]